MSAYLELHVCAGCLCEVANGDSSLTDTERETHYRRMDTLTGHVVATGDEYGFSHRRCELCDGLAGDRYSVHVLERDGGE